MKTLYHATSEKNLGSILDKGLLHKWEGVYLTDSADSAARWIGFRLAAVGEPTVIVIEVNVDESNLSEGCDHSPLMQQIFGVGESIVHNGDIPSSQITNVIRYELNNEVKK
jgi:hypothetical protein